MKSLPYHLLPLYLLLAVSTVTDASNQKTALFITTHMPPYSVDRKIDPTVNGIFLDYLNLVEQQLSGQSIHIVFMPWKRAQQEINRSGGDARFLFPVGRTALRETKYTWLSKVVTDSVSFYAHSDRESEVSKASVIGVLRASSGLQLLRQKGFKNIFECLDVGNCASMLMKGRIDFWLAPSFIAVHVFKKAGYPLAKLKKVWQLKQVDFYIVAQNDLPLEQSRFWKKIFSSVLHSKSFLEQLHQYKQ